MIHPSRFFIVLFVLFTYSIASIPFSSPYPASNANLTFTGFPTLPQVAFVGDFNNDSVQDFIFSNPSATVSSQIGAGQSWLIYGKEENEIQIQLNDLSMTSTIGLVFNGTDLYENAGYSVSRAGDFNNDGIDDFLIGAPQLTETFGYVYLIFGGNTNQTGTIPLSTLNGSFGVVFNGTELGFNLSSAGDFNNDGFDDLLICAENDFGFTGVVYLVYGTNSTTTQPFQMSTLNSTYGISFYGSSTGELFGASVAPAGDLNQDGYDDILIGAPLSSSGSSFGGSVYCLWGNSSWGESFNVSNLNSTTGVEFVSITAAQAIGTQVSAAGDVNNDGSLDILFSSKYPYSEAGAAYLVFGPISNFASPYSVEFLDGTNGVLFYGSNAFERLGYSISGAGDINNDGFDDILIGAPWVDYNSLQDAGVVTLIYGTNDTWLASYEVSNMTLPNAVHFPGSDHLDVVGQDLSSGFDVNNDGFDDILISSDVGYTMFYGRYSCPTGYFSNSSLSCNPCTPFEKGKQFISNNGDCLDIDTQFQCPFGYYAKNADPIWECIQCPSSNALGKYTTFGFAEKCDFEFTSKCPAESRLINTSGVYFDTYSCESCESTFNNAPNLETECHCLSGTVLIGDQCLVGSESYSPSALGAATWSSLLVLVGGLIFYLKQKSIKQTLIDPSEPLPFHPIPYVTFKDFVGSSSTLDRNTLVSAFQAISLFIWSPFLNTHTLKSLHFSYPQILCIIDFFKKVPFVPRSKTHLKFHEKSILYYPIISGMGIIGMIFTLSIRWSSSIFYGNWVSYFIFYFGKNFYTVGVWFSIISSFILFACILSSRHKLYQAISRLLILPILFNFLSVFNCVELGDYYQNVDHSKTYIELSRGGENIECYHGIHIGLVMYISLNLIFHSMYLLRHNKVAKIPHFFKSFTLCVFYHLFSSAWYWSAFIQIPVILFYCIFILSRAKKAPVGVTRDLHLFAYGFCIVVCVIAFIAKSIDNPSNLASGILVVLTGLIAFFLGIPFLEHRYFSRNFKFFFDFDIDESSIESDQVVPSDDLNDEDGKAVSTEPVTDSVTDSVKEPDSENPQDIPLNDLSKPPSVSLSTLAIILILISIIFSVDPQLTLDQTPYFGGVEFNGILPNDESGIFVGFAGDFNGDGFDDVMISATGAEPNGPNSGQVYLVLGSNSTTLSSNLADYITFNGETSGDFAGYSTSSAGDVNNDGFDDILISAYYASPYGFSKAGIIYLIYGNSTPQSEYNLSSINSTTGAKIYGGETDQNCGNSLSFVGDINNDLKDDFLIGCPGSFGTFGAAYLLYGDQFGSEFNLSDVNGGNGIVIVGTDAGDQLGYALSSRNNDFNNDSIPDLLIGAYYASPNSIASSGQSYIIFGNTSFPSVISVSDIDSSTGIVFNGETIGDVSGLAVQFVDDVNNDDFDDILISAPYADPNGSESGKIYLVYGYGGFSTTPFNLSSLNSTTGVVLTGISSSDYAGVSVSGVNDVNQDGFADFLIGAQFADPKTKSDSGQAYLVYGSSSLPSVIPLSSLNGTNGIKFDGVASDDYAGCSVSTAGDFNNDTFPDFIIGADWADPNNINRAGSSYLVFGGPKTKFIMCDEGYKLQSNQCISCDNSTSNGAYNIFPSYETSCVFSPWSDCGSYCSCDSNQYIQPVGLGRECQNCSSSSLNNGYYPSQPPQTFCLPICDPGFYVNKPGSPLYQCTACVVAEANPEPSSSFECIVPEKKSLVFFVDSEPLTAYLITFVSLIGGLFLLILHRSKNDPKKVFSQSDFDEKAARTLYSQSLNRLSSLNTENFVEMFGVLLDISMCLLYFSKDILIVKETGSNSISDPDSSKTKLFVPISFEDSIVPVDPDPVLDPSVDPVDLVDLDFEIDSIALKMTPSETEDVPSPPQETEETFLPVFSQSLQYFENTPFLFENPQYYSLKDRLVFVKTVIQHFQLIGLLSGLTLVKSSMSNSESLFIFDLFNLNIGAIDFRVIFWMFVFFILLWNIFVHGHRFDHNPVIQLITSFDYRFVPVLGGVLMIPIINNMFKALICTHVEDHGTFLAATITPDSVANGIECYTSEHILLMVFAILSLLAYIPSLILHFPKVKYFSKSQLINKPEFARISLSTKLLATTVCTFLGLQLNSNIQMLTCSIVLVTFCILGASNFYLKPCITFDFFNTFRIGLAVIGSLFSIIFLIAVAIDDATNIISIVFFYLCLAALVGFLLWSAKKAHQIGFF